MATKIKANVINRFAPVGPVSTGRLDVKAPDISQGARAQTAALTGAASDAIKFMERKEDEAIDSATSKITDDYEREFNTGLLNLKSKGGDPSKLYRDFDDKMNKRRAEIFGDDEMSDKFSRILEGKLGNRAGSLEMKSLTQSSGQQLRYDSDNFKAGNKLTQNRAVGKLGMPGEEGDFSLFQTELDILTTDHKKQGVKRGTVLVKDGKIVKNGIGKSVQVAMGQDVSDTITLGINTLIARGDTDRADQMRERYKEQILNVSKIKIDKNLSETKDSQQVFADATKIQNMKPEKRQAALNNLGIERRVKVGKVLDDVASSEKKRDDINSSNTYNNLHDVIEEKNITSITSLEASEEYKAMKGTLNPKDLRDLRSRVEKPKTNNQKVYTAALDKLAAGELKGMSGSDLTKMTSGLNGETSKFFRSQWRKDNDESLSQERARANSMVGGIRRQAIGIGLVKKRRGFLTTKDDAYIASLQTRLLLEFDKLPKNMSTKEQNDFIKQFLADEAFDKGKDITPLPPIRAARKLDPNFRTLSDLTAEAQVRLTDDFVKARGRDPVSNNELVEFLNKDN